MAVSITSMNQIASNFSALGNMFLKIFSLIHVPLRIAGYPIVCMPLEQHSADMKYWSTRS